MCAAQHPPELPPVVRLIFDFMPESDGRTVWFVCRRQTGWRPLEDVYSDFAINPVPTRVEGEWLDVMSGLLGSALVHLVPGQLPLSLASPADHLDEEADTSS